MEDKIVRICAFGSFGLMLVVCALFFYLPDLHRYEERVRAQFTREAALRDNIRQLDELTGIELLQYNNQLSGYAEEDPSFDGQIRLALPEGVSSDQVTIENDPLHETIVIKFPGGTDDYMYQYPMLGTPENILDLNYECNGTEGRIEILMDGVYECISRDGGDGLYLSFANPHDIYDYVVVVDAGHGGLDSGASREGIYEKDLNLGMLLELKSILDTRAGDTIGVYYTRTEDVGPTYEDRVTLANKLEADLFISIHNDAAKREESDAEGTTVLYQGAKGNSYNAKEMAENIAKAVTETIGSENRGGVEADDIYIIRHSEVPVFLIEIGFMSNHDELQKLNTEQYQRLAAEGIYKGILRAYSGAE